MKASVASIEKLFRAELFNFHPCFIRFQPAVLAPVAAGPWLNSISVFPFPFFILPSL
jgi:hypothetical protein